jgi:hypothetical protein
VSTQAKPSRDHSAAATVEQATSQLEPLSALSHRAKLSSPTLLKSRASGSA